MTSVVYPPPSHSTVTGLSLRFWSPPLGAPVRCSRHFIFATFNTNMMVFCLWVCLWLRVRGSGSPHLFLTCSGGGGGTTPLPRGSFTCFSGWMRGLPIQLLSGVGVLPFFIGFNFAILKCLRFLFFYVYCFIACPCLKHVPYGCASWRHDVTSDWVDLGSPSRTSRTLSHAWLVVTTAAPVASSDRHSVALALSSSL